MKDKKSILITSAIVIFIVSLAIINNLNAKSTYFKINISSKSSWEKTYNVSEFDSIVVDTYAIDLKVVASNDSDIHLKISDSLKNVQYKMEDRVLEIGETKKNICHFCLLLNNYIEVALPDTYNGPITLKNHKADMHIANIKTKLNIENRDGEITLNDLSDLTISNKMGNIRGKNVFIEKITTQSGNITLNNATPLPDAQIISDSGNINLTFTNDVYVEYKTNTGNVKISNSSLKDNLSIYIETNSGAIQVN